MIKCDIEFACTVTVLQSKENVYLFDAVYQWQLQVKEILGLGLIQPVSQILCLILCGILAAYLWLCPGYVQQIISILNHCICLAHLYAKFRSVFLSFRWTNKVLMYIFLVFKNYLHISSSLAISNWQLSVLRQ